MKHTFVRGLALTIGACTIPSAAMAQYSVGEPGAGLSSGAYNPLPNAGVASMMIPGAPAGYQSSGAVGSGVPNAPLPSTASSASPFSGYPAPTMNGSAPIANNLILSRNSVLGQDAEPSAQTDVAPAVADSIATTSLNSSVSCPDACFGPPMRSLSPWIFGANALVFDRLDRDCTALTYNANDPTFPILCTQLVDMPTTGGFELFGGRYFGCGRYAVIGSYWGVFSQQQHASITPSTGIDLTSALPFTIDSPYGGATSGIEMSSQWVSDWFDQAELHRVTREQSFQNAEVNFVSFALGGGARQPYGNDCKPGLFGSGCGSDCGPGPTGPCAPWYGAQCSKLRLNLFAGFRWFQFRDQLEFGASESDDIFDYSADDFFYQNHVTNNLFGGQLGATGTWCTGRYVNLFGGTSFGVYNNRMSLESYAGTANEIATVLSANQFNGQDFSFTADDNDIALLGEANLGVGVRVCRGWTANIGYRLVGVSGVATSVGQIPRDFSNLNGAWKLHNDHSLMLHGLTVGAAYNF